MNGASAIDWLAAAARRGAERPLTLNASAIAAAERDAPQSREQRGAAGRAFWNEIYLELRRQAGDERLPASLRRSLRALAGHAFGRASRQPGAGLPRQLLRSAIPVIVSADVAANGSREAAAAGIDLERPFVAIELRNRPDVLVDAVELLAARGYAVIRVGGGAPDRFRHPGVIDVVASGQMTPALELLLMARARFVVSGGATAQQVSYLFDTPSLTLNALDPFALYPIRSNGVFLLRSALDVDSGRAVAPEEEFSESFFRNRRNIGWREHAAADVTAAVHEMLDGIESGWRDTEAQTRYRHQATRAGTMLAGSIRYLREVGPEDGFLGDGRLARVQAERIA